MSADEQAADYLTRLQVGDVRTRLEDARGRSLRYEDAQAVVVLLEACTASELRILLLDVLQSHSDLIVAVNSAGTARVTQG